MSPMITNTYFVCAKGESGTVFLVLSPVSGDDCLFFEGHVAILIRTTGYECSGGPT